MDYEIIYSGRKSVALSVKDHKLYIKAPYGTSKDKISKIVHDHLSWIKKQLERQSVPRIKDRPISDEQIRTIKKTAKIILKQKTDKYAEIMGLKYGRITITSAKHRFGSCNSKGNIAYSYLLLLYNKVFLHFF